ncbi:hypothetical protein ACFWJT_19070 [Streptomyces sp. NPDC127069]|uniref:hypothetical protein n=1 Tax=Streptomyces sp. NPDC127069 TaxID=3347128 RepID=UPI00364AC30B|nr:hypothetical protein [Streptomyces polychromogenes]
MDEQGGAGGVPLHGDDDPQRQRKPHPERSASGPSRPREAPGPVRREDTDEASRLDRPAPPDPEPPLRRGGHGGGHG